ncbi:hypothetical protein PJW08_14250 [Tenacibaculum finnmarkense]|nr:hypothetical protein PJW08_14250 [Tenacibaculum finnmarkense]
MLLLGFAIIFYTNPRPFEPRERDYAVVGSFYVFAIWIGFGVFALYDYLKNYANKRTVAIGVSAVSLLAVPVLMGVQNWDDHDRGDRFIAQLNAQTYLESCDPNAIIFTIGDNDTFPLWYMQQVEGVRQDIKIVNTSLFQTAWYIDQMKKKTYQAEPIPSQLTHEQYKYGTLDMAYHIAHPRFKDSIMSINNFMRWIESDNDQTYYIDEENDVREKFYPTNHIRIPVNKANVLKTGLVAQKDADKILDYIDITVSEQGLTKNRILMLDILNNFQWKRPIYFTGGANADEEYIWLKDYLQLDGMSYKFVPIKTSNKGKSMFSMGRIDTKKMHDNVKKWNWKTINNGKIYLDEQSKRNAISIRNNLMRLSEEYLKEGDSVNAKDVLDLSLYKLPIKQFEHYSVSLEYPELYYRMGDIEKAHETVETLIDVFQQKLKYYSTFKDQDVDLIIDNLETSLYMYQNLIQQITKYDNDMEYGKKAFEAYLNHANLFKHLMANEPQQPVRELDTIKP